MSDGTGTTSYAYDLRDRLLTKTTPEGSLTYTYDAAGNRSSVKSESGSYDVTYGYDELNRLRSVTDNTAGGGTTLYHYDDGGRLTAYDYPNGVTTSLDYDANNRVKKVTIGSLASYVYDFYATGNRKSVIEKSGRKVTWQYDNLWRLTTETIAGTTNSDGAIGYVYDDVGNRLSRSSSVAGIPNQTSGYDDDDRLLSDGWDPNGNTLSSGGNQYGYDSENRLLSLNTSQARYVYDGDGQLVQRTASGVTTSYLIDDQTPAGYTQVVEERVSVAVLKSYVFGPQRISLHDPAGLHYYGYDAHSGVRLLMDRTGAVTDMWDYDAFGNMIARTGSTANEFTYRGEQLDDQFGIQYLRARWMDLASGRFLTRDRVDGGSRGLGIGHSYVYASQDAIGRIDPAGMDDIASTSFADVSFGAGFTTRSLFGATGANTLPTPLAATLTLVAHNRAVSVSVHGDDVSIEVAISFEGRLPGGGPPFAIATFQSEWSEMEQAARGGIQRYWSGNGAPIGRYHVSTRLTAGKNPQAWYLIPGSGRSEWDPTVQTSPVRLYKYDEFGVEDSFLEGTAAHEFGHVLGLDDEYDPVTGTPLYGFKGDIMADHIHGVVQQFDIDAIVQAYAR